MLEWENSHVASSMWKLHDFIKCFAFFFSTTLSFTQTLLLYKSFRRKIFAPSVRDVRWRWLIGDKSRENVFVGDSRDIDVYGRAVLAVTGSAMSCGEMLGNSNKNIPSAYPSYKDFVLEFYFSFTVPIRNVAKVVKVLRSSEISTIWARVECTNFDMMMDVGNSWVAVTKINQFHLRKCRFLIGYLKKWISSLIKVTITTDEFVFDCINVISEILWRYFIK